MAARGAPAVAEQRGSKSVRRPLDAADTMATMGQPAAGVVEFVHRNEQHSFSKETIDAVTLAAGLGVIGDAHCGAVVQHRSRVAADPTQPNLRQVHLIAGELLDELQGRGFAVGPGDLGENITTRGLDLLALGTGTLLRFGEGPLVAITGLRNPCAQLDRFQDGLMNAVLDRSSDGSLVRRAGAMGVVVLGGVVAAGDSISISAPPGEPVPLRPV